MPQSRRFCDLTPKEAATTVESMRRDASAVDSKQAAQTFLHNLRTLGRIQQNQRLEIDAQGNFRLESTTSRKFAINRSRSITVLHPFVLQVLYRAQIECFYPTPQVCNVLGKNLDFSGFAQHGSRQRRHSDAVLRPQGGFGWITQELAEAAHEISLSMNSARDGLNNMLAGYRSQHSFFNNKDDQIACVNDLVAQADSARTTYLFSNYDDSNSISKVIELKSDIQQNPQLWHGGWSTSADVSATKDFFRSLNDALTKKILRDDASQCSLLLWGHHKLRGGWEYVDLDPFFDLAKSRHSSQHCWDRACQKGICDTGAVSRWAKYMNRQRKKIEALFKTEYFKKLNRRNKQQFR